MGTPKHTPGPLHNGQPCTCCILLRTGDPLESIHGNQPCSDISRIELCPKHAAAPAMYEALRRLHDVLDTRLPSGLAVNQVLPKELFDLFYGPAIEARQALAQAERKL